jgi:TonB-linked SusC/RagA family outer membrane protein
VRVLRLGYAEATDTVIVLAGQARIQNFALLPVAVSLPAVVTTVTGQERRVEVGNAIAQVNARELVEQRPITNVTDLLTARVPGVQVLPGTSTGIGSRVRIRGVNSLSLSNDPIYVIDGVRMNSANGSSSISTGGSLPSRVGDLNPDEIDRIEVVRGPSAATLYGTDAANGVIVITTKRGQAGRPQWNAYTEQGVVTDLNHYPTAYSVFGRRTNGTATSTCFLRVMAVGACRQDSITTYNLFNDSRTTPFKAAGRSVYGLQVSGGSETVRYFVSGEMEDETGRYEMPQVFLDRLAQAGTAVSDEWRRPNAYRRVSGRANLNLNLSPTAELAVSTNYITSNFRFLNTDNNTVGLLSNALGGPGRRNNTVGGDSLYGYRLFTPDRIFQNVTTQGIDRFIGGLNLDWRPTSWLSARANAGADFTSRVDQSLCRFDQCVRAFEFDLGFKNDNRTTFYNYTADVAATATFQPRSWMSSRSTAGVQFFHQDFDRNGTTGAHLPPGGSTVTQAAILTADEVTQVSRTVGAFVEQNFAFNNRLFSTLGLRADDNSAFGADFKAVYYPKASVSWVVTEEPFFPRISWLDQLRLRTAWGASGNQPGTTDAVRFLIGRTAVLDQAATPGVSFGYLGNTKLKPERTQELEMGFDATLLASRVNLEVTYYNKNSRDALVQRVLPPTVGSDSTVVFDNIGRVRNWGWEALVNAQLIARHGFGWDVALSGATNSNKILSLGHVPPIIGTTIDQREGYPLNSYFERPYTYRDANGDGIISPSEVTVGADRTFLGYSIPRTEVTLTNGLDFLNRRIRVAALFDYKGGHKLYNNTERIRCASRLNCRGLIDPRAPLSEQARVIALTATSTRTIAGFIEDASFVRFRELSVVLNAPATWAQRFARARSASLVLSGRNLKKWTHFTGIDPEANYDFQDIPQNFQTAGPASYFTVRFNLGF